MLPSRARRYFHSAARAKFGSKFDHGAATSSRCNRKPIRLVLRAEGAMREQGRRQILRGATGAALEDRTTLAFAKLIEREFGGFVAPP